MIAVLYTHWSVLCSILNLISWVKWTEKQRFPLDSITEKGSVRAIHSD